MVPVTPLISSKCPKLQLSVKTLQTGIFIRIYKTKETKVIDLSFNHHWLPFTFFNLKTIFRCWSRLAPHIFETERVTPSLQIYTRQDLNGKTAYKSDFNKQKSYHSECWSVVAPYVHLTSESIIAMSYLFMNACRISQRIHSVREWVIVV